MAKLKFTGNAEAPVTYQGKYEVTTGAVLEDVPEADANTLLQTGAFEAVDGDSASTSDDDDGKGSKSGKKSSTSNDDDDDGKSSKK